MTKEEKMEMDSMRDRLTRRFGLEDSVTISFCIVCDQYEAGERWTFDFIKKFYHLMMEDQK